MPALSEIAALLPRGTNDNGSTNSNLSDGAIIVIVLVGAGFLVLIGFAVTRFWVPDGRNEEAQLQYGGDFSQAQYMRDVRLRNHETIEAVAGVPRPPMRQADSYNDYSGYPSGYSNASAGGGGYTDTASRYE